MRAVNLRAHGLAEQMTDGAITPEMLARAADHLGEPTHYERTYEPLEPPVPDHEMYSAERLREKVKHCENELRHAERFETRHPDPQLRIGCGPVYAAEQQLRHWREALTLRLALDAARRVRT